MENKYYTPTIEEFHVGFECEICDSNNDWSIAKSTLTSFDTDYLVEVIQKKRARVKYLDREDIESLGWISTTVSDGANYLMGGFYFNITDNQGHKWDVSIYSMDETNSQFHFLGRIKNKSELKKLMQQLQII
jgi:hypothetical protein